MSDFGTGAFPFPIRFADIIFAHQIPDPHGRNAKTRRVVVLTPDSALRAGFPIVVAAVTGTLPTPLGADYVLLPYKNPPGTRHPKTGLTKKAAVLCTWLVLVDRGNVAGRSGFVPPAAMILIHSKTAGAAGAIGGWGLP